MPRAITNRTNQSTAFSDAMSTTNSRMKDSFTPKPAVPRFSACGKATDTTAANQERANNLSKNKSSTISDITTGGKLDAGRGKIEGSEPKKYTKRRTSGEKLKDANHIKAGDEALAGMLQVQKVLDLRAQGF